jgi:hypothetical protein
MATFLKPTILALSALALAGGMIALGPGCTVLTNDGLPLDATVYDGPTEGGTPACTACVANECTAIWAVCLNDARCQAIHTCASASGCGADCRASCACSSTSSSDASTRDGGGIDAVGAYAAFASCNDARTCSACKNDCAAQCASGSPATTAASCGGGTDSGTDAGSDSGVDAGDGGDAAADDAGTETDGGTTPVVPSVDGCASCTAGKCGDAKKQCVLGSECAAYLTCAKACADAACVDDCGRQHATGKAASVELAACTTASCSEVCGF